MIATTQPLGALIDKSYKPRVSAANDDEVWNLNLDQIEPHSGRVLSRCRLSVTEPPRVSWRLFGLSQAATVVA